MRKLFLIPILGALGAVAQVQHSNWYFGYGAGLSFSSGTAASLEGNPFETDEGAASISDADGDLLFFTNGEALYDRTLALMPNGDDLAGHYSAAQSALIVPAVDDPGRYYVFTVPSQVASWEGLYSGLTYSVVDMDLNGGLGDVTLKNIELQAEVTEHLTATRHANGRDVWVVVHGWESDNFYSYLVTCTGIEGPVVSQAGEAIEQDIWGQYVPAIGCMDISPQGDRLAMTWSAFGSEDGRAHLEVLAFDPATGMVGEGFAVDHGGTPALNARGYGVSFSPNGSRLYWSDSGLAGGIGYASIFQYDLLAADPAATEFLAASGIGAFGTLQVGPDGQLYCASLDGAMHVSRITAPDELGAACGFDGPGVSIAPHLATWGLANDWDVPTVEVPIDLGLSDTLVCAGQPFLVEVDPGLPFEEPTYLWNTGATTSSIAIDEDGLYSVEVFLSCDRVLRDSMRVTFSNIEAALGEDRLVCEGDSVTLTVPDPSATFFWSTGSTDPSIVVGSSDLYWLEVLDGHGCMVRDEVELEFFDCTCPVFVPNTFTPNGDQVNDAFGVRSACPFEQYRLVVFDRWGAELYSSTEPDGLWAGDVPIGVYTWTLEYAWPDEAGLRQAKKQGHVTVLR
ncbi:MAG TPA: gliding motility-associated C-terminal domain-containing protein [Flavobacteriales bacterium]